MTIRAPLTHDHGTPPEYIALMHEVFQGDPDLDPSSHPKWNDAIRAKRIITEAMDARVSEWFPGAPLPNRLLTDRSCRPDDEDGELVHENPPNDADGSLVSFFWRTSVEYWLRGWARAVFFVGFNVEQLARNQRVGARSSPLKHPTIVPAARPRYMDGETLQPQPQPMHASFITLLTHDHHHIRRFAALGRELGDVVNVHGY
jgi:hypothetical protein